MTKSRNIRAPRVVWTEPQIEELRRRYPHEKTEQIAADIGMTLGRTYRKAIAMGLRKTAEYLASPDAQRLRRGDNVGAAYRFPKGYVPANKGVKGVCHEGCKPTQFKKGNKPHTWKPIGTERYSKQGYLQRKMADTGLTRRDYVPVHHLIWKEAGRDIPKGFHLSFKDGNKANITLENLELVSFADMMKRNTIHNLPPEPKEVLQLKGALNRRITCHERHKRTQKTSI